MAEQKTYIFFYKCLTSKELQRSILKKSNFILIDLIGTYKGNKYRIQGATTIPYPEVIDRRKELRRYDEIILYTTNKACDAARKRAVGLQLIGFDNVLVYDAGLDDWTAHDLPVEEY